MQQLSIQINNLPLQLICIENGQIAIQPTEKFSTIIDDTGAIFDSVGFSINEVGYEYGKMLSYKEDSGLLQWLQKQEMPIPVIQKPAQGGFANMHEAFAEMMRRAQGDL